MKNPPIAGFSLVVRAAMCHEQPAIAIDMKFGFSAIAGGGGSDM
jgi:hypothetical protein